MDERLKSLPPAELDNIMEIARRIAEAVHPLRIYLFGSFADGTWGDDSDYDFYIVVEDGRDVMDARMRAGISIWDIQKRPVDILGDCSTLFEKIAEAPDSLFVESEVNKKGSILYSNDDYEAIAV